MKSKLKIAEPCHENWNNMTPVEKGKHCTVCAKQVVDFTENSREEIIGYLGETEGQTCGRFKEGQIDIYGDNNNAAKKTAIPFYKAIAASVLAVLGAGINPITAQDGEYFEMGEIAYEPIETVVSNNADIKLQGLIKSHGGLVTNAKISVFSGGKLIMSMRSKEDGKYLFELKKGTLVNNRFTLKIFAAGFESKTIESLEVNKAEITIDISMEHEMMIMGKIMIHPKVLDVEQPVIEEQEIKVEPEEKTFYKGNACVIEKEVEEELETPDSSEYTIGTVAITVEPVGPIDITKTEGIEEGSRKLIIDKETVVSKITTPLEITVYPNPSASQVFVRTNKNDTYQYAVTDLNGKLVFSGIKKGETFELNFAGKPNGVYLISIYQNGAAIETKRIIISH